MPLQVGHPNLISLTPANATVWRFMSLGKFLNLLANRSLFFCQLFAMREQDPFEGQYARPNVEMERKFASDDEFARKALNSENMKMISTLREFGAMFGSPAFATKMSKTMYISCWHSNLVEPAGLWRLYSDLEQGVAIKSSLARLVDALAFTNPDIQIGKMKYIDYDAHQIETGNVLSIAYRKRKNFEFENEVRMTILDSSSLIDPGTEKAGLLIPCDLERLLESVVIGPNSPSWLFDTVRKSVAAFGFSFPIYKSTLFEEPDYLN